MSGRIGRANPKSSQAARFQLRNLRKNHLEKLDEARKLKPLPADLPAHCCGRCTWFVRVIGKAGRCDWTAPPPVATAYGSRLTQADEGTACQVFHPRTDAAAVAPPPEDLPLFRSAAPVDIFDDQEDL